MKKTLSGLAVIALLGGAFAAYKLSSGDRRIERLPAYVQSIEPQPGTEGMTAMIAGIDEVLEGNWLARMRGEFSRQRTFWGDISDERDALRRMTQASKLLTTGATEEALVQFHEIEQFVQTSDVSEELAAELDRHIAISYLRLGEQQNCFNNPHASACIIPLNPDAVHQLREGSSRAIEYLEGRVLARDPDDHGSKWLLNIAYMTLGEYPDGVPEEHLVQMPGLIENYSGPTFANVADFAGVDDINLSGAAVVDDFNNDGLPDLYTTAWSATGDVRFYLRNEDGSFEDRTDAAGLGGLNGGLSAIHADFDNDGFVDVYQMRGAWAGVAGMRPNSLLRNMGDGTFEDVTVAAGILEFEPTITSAFADLNNDGWLDLVVANERARPLRDHGEISIFINDRQGGFTRLPEERTFAITCNPKGVAISDYDGDDFADIFVSCQRTTNVLLRNLSGQSDGNLAFEDVTETAGLTGHDYSFSAWFFDYDNDGHQDLFVASYSLEDSLDSPSVMARSYLGLANDEKHPALYRNRGDGTFEDVSLQAGLGAPAFAMGANYGDFDGDGWLDIYLGTGAPALQAIYPNIALHNQGGERFLDISASSGLGHIQKGHGIAFADFDNDGDEDIFAQMGGAVPGDTFQNALFENLGPENGWLKLKLEGRESNRSAIGAVIRVDVVMQSGLARSIYRRVDTGGSFGSNPLLRHIGLGEVRRIDQVEVYWPATGIRQSFDALEPGHAYRVIEGETQARPMVLPSHPLTSVSRPVPAHDHGGH